MAQAQTSPKTPNMLYPGCALRAADGGPAQTHLLCRLHVPAVALAAAQSTDSPVARELGQPRTEADVEARYGEQHESLRACPDSRLTEVQAEPHYSARCARCRTC